jgi:hypothetical protein
MLVLTKGRPRVATDAEERSMKARMKLDTTQLGDVLEYLTVKGILRWHKEMDGARADVFLRIEDDDGNPVVSLNSSPLTSEDVDGDESEVIGVSYPVTSKIYSLITDEIKEVYTR